MLKNSWKNFNKFLTVGNYMNKILKCCNCEIFFVGKFSEVEQCPKCFSYNIYYSPEFQNVNIEEKNKELNEKLEKQKKLKEQRMNNMKNRNIIRITIKEESYTRLSDNILYQNKSEAVDLPLFPLASYDQLFDRMPTKSELLQYIEKSKSKTNAIDHNAQNCYEIVKNLEKIPSIEQPCKYWNLEWGQFDTITYRISGTINVIQVNVAILGNMIDETRLTFDYRKNRICGRSVVEGFDEITIDVPLNNGGKIGIAKWQDTINQLFKEKEKGKLNETHTN